MYMYDVSVCSILSYQQCMTVKLLVLNCSRHIFKSGYSYNWLDNYKTFKHLHKSLDENDTVLRPEQWSCLQLPRSTLFFGVGPEVSKAKSKLLKNWGWIVTRILIKGLFRKKMDSKVFRPDYSFLFGRVNQNLTVVCWAYHVIHVLEPCDKDIYNVLHVYRFICFTDYKAPCIDRLTYCGLYELDTVCTDYSGWARYNCKRSCNKCQ